MPLPINISEVSPEAYNVRDLLSGILERVQAVFQSYNVPLPERQYWTVGLDPAIDCEQLVVSLSQIYLGIPGDQATIPQKCTSPRTASVSVLLSRAVPTVGPSGRAPSAQRIEESSHIAAIDSWVLMESINLMDQWDELGYGLGVIATLDILGPEGGYVSVNLQLTLAVP
jgi:hypothetical protein